LATACEPLFSRLDNNCGSRPPDCHRKDQQQHSVWV